MEKIALFQVDHTRMLPGMYISRVGGDEFALILTGASDEQTEAFFQDVLEAIREPITIGASARRGSASIGVAR
mgnify:CR=1 FL=1